MSSRQVTGSSRTHRDLTAHVATLLCCHVGTGRAPNKKTLAVMAAVLLLLLLLLLPPPLLLLLLLLLPLLLHCCHAEGLPR